MEWAKRNMYVSPVGAEEMAHWEMIGTMIHQCMTGATCEELRRPGWMGTTSSTATACSRSTRTACRLPRRTSSARAIPSPTFPRTWRPMLQSYKNNFSLKVPVNFNGNIPGSRNTFADGYIINQRFHDFAGSSVPSLYNSQSVRGDYRPPQFFHRVRLTAFHRCNYTF